MGVLGTQFSEQVVSIEGDLAVQKVVKAHHDKIVEAKIRTLRKELAQIQRQAHEFDDLCCSIAARAQDMLEYVERGMTHLLPIFAYFLTFVCRGG